MSDSNQKPDSPALITNMENLKNKLANYILEKRSSMVNDKPKLSKETNVDWDKNKDIFFKMPEGKQNNFLGKWIDCISSILDIKTWEDVYALQKNDASKKLEIPEIEKIGEILTPFLKIANKNRHDGNFEDYKKENNVIYHNLAILRVMSYWIRAYANFALGYTHRDAHKLSRPALYKNALNDIYKALRILERDLHLHDIIDIENNRKIKKNFKELRWDWCIYLSILILKGETYYRQYDYARALDCYCKALRLCRNTEERFKISVRNHETAVACYHKGTIFLDRGEFLEAIKWLLRALMLTPVDKPSKQFTRIKEKIEKDIIAEIDKFKVRKKYKKDFLIKYFIANPDFLVEDFKKVTEEYKFYRSRIFNRLGFAINTVLQADEVTPNIEWFRAGFELDNTNYLCLHNIARFIPKEKREDSLQEYRNLLKKFISVGKVSYSEFPQMIASYTMYKSVFMGPFTESSDSKMKCKENMLAELLANIDNIADRPEIFYQQFASERKVDNEINKLIILKKWSSFTPNIPRPTGQRIPERTYFAGGGYFLIWNKKGIVIDPGFNFIENLYQVGYSIADIDAVIVTHAHTDHTNDIDNILTLLYERNNYFRHKGQPLNQQREIDVLLNVGTMQKYLPWLSKQLGGTIRRIIMLPRCVTNQTEDTNSENFILDLKEHGYELTLEVTHAKHDEIISSNTAVGLKFNLYFKNSRNESQTIKVGFTSDTGKEGNIIEQYLDCDFLILHLGDTNYRELIKFADLTFEKADIENIGSILKRWENHEIAIDFMRGQSFWLGARDRLKDANNIKKLLSALVEFEAEDTLNRYHLSFQGIFDIVEGCKSSGNAKVIVIGEFPEYLGSLRDKIAGCLNEFVGKKLCFSGDIGMEIGLCVNGEEARKIEIQCSYCALDNDLNSEDKFHKPEEMQEILVRASGQAMLYLCKKHKINQDEFIEKKSI